MARRPNDPQRRERILQATLETRLASWETGMYKRYEKQFEGKYHGRELAFVSRMAVAQRLQPVRSQLRTMLEVKGSVLLKEMLRDAPAGPFSTNVLWDRAIAEGRLFGVAFTGRWFEVGTPQAIRPTEAVLAGGS